MPMSLAASQVTYVKYDFESHNTTTAAAQELISSSLETKLAEYKRHRKLPAVEVLIVLTTSAHKLRAVLKRSVAELTRDLVEGKSATKHPRQNSQRAVYHPCFPILDKGLRPWLLRYGPTYNGLSQH